MPFLGPVAGPLVAKAGMTVGGSLLGSLLGKAKPTKDETGVLQNAQATQKFGLQTGQNLIGQGTQGAQAPMNYWSSILSGNRSGITSALGPELMRLGEGYSAASRNSAALNPRGGPSSTFMGELPWQQQRDTTTLLQGARPQAAASLFDSANRLMSQGANAISMSTAAGRNILDQQENLRRTSESRGQQIGAGLFDLIRNYGPQIDQWFKSKGGSGTATGGILGEYP